MDGKHFWCIVIGVVIGYLLGIYFPQIGQGLKAKVATVTGQ
jgi:Na+/H+-dicarboxylate symporter